MKHAAAVVLAVGSFAIAGSAKADFSLGTNFGAGVAFVDRRNPPTGQSATYKDFFIGWPYNFSQGYPLPGIRLGITNDVGRHEVYIDSTVNHHSDPATYTSVLLLIAYQHNFEPHASNTFYFTAGGGPMIVSQAYGDATTFLVGGGVGFRQRVSDGHGTFREELRLDFVARRSGSPVCGGGLACGDVVDQTIILGFKFGFDLWFR